VFYAPVAMRITAYGLPVSAQTQAYVQAHLNDPAFLKWRALAMQETHEPFPYDLGLARKEWPQSTS
jgi:glutathione S-transferase